MENLRLQAGVLQRQGVDIVVHQLAAHGHVAHIQQRRAVAGNAAEHHPLCVEMEGAAVAQVCVKNSVPFVVVRSMSDNADEEAFEKIVVKQFDCTEYCNTAAAIVLDILANA